MFQEYLKVAYKCYIRAYLLQYQGPNPITPKTIEIFVSTMLCSAFKHYCMVPPIKIHNVICHSQVYGTTELSFTQMTRCYAVVANKKRVDTNRTSVTDPYYPSNRDNPSPYEIFHTVYTNGSIDVKKLKKQYHLFVKIYHPDNFNQYRVLRGGTRLGNGKLPYLTDTEKLHRFKVISGSYHYLLKHLSDRIPSPHTYDGGIYTYHAAKPHMKQHGSMYTEPLWMDQNPLHEDKFTIRNALICFASLIICFQVMAFLTKIQDTYVTKKLDLEFDERIINSHLLQAYNNYGLGTDKESRIRRFLWYRSYQQYLKDPDSDVLITKDLIENEKLIQKLKMNGKANEISNKK